MLVWGFLISDPHLRALAHGSRENALHAKQCLIGFAGIAVICGDSEATAYEQSASRVGIHCILGFCMCLSPLPLSAGMRLGSWFIGVSLPGLRSAWLQPRLVGIYCPCAASDPLSASVSSTGGPPASVSGLSSHHSRGCPYRGWQPPTIDGPLYPGLRQVAAKPAT